MSDFLDEFLTDIGFGGAETGADIVRLLGVEDPALQGRFGRGIEPLFGTVRKGLGELPALLSTLTGQAQTTAGIGRERVARGFQTGRAGLEQRGIELGRAGQTALARAGFAGAGAPQRQQRLGRRQLGQQFMDVLGARRTGMAGVEAGFEQALFGAEQRVESERAGLLGSLGGGIQNLLNALISGGVQFGAGGGERLSYSDWLARNPGGTIQEWGQYRTGLVGATPTTGPGEAERLDLFGEEAVAPIGELPESYESWRRENPGGTYDEYVEFVESLGY